MSSIAVFTGVGFGQRQVGGGIYYPYIVLDGNPRNSGVGGSHNRGYIYSYIIKLSCCIRYIWCATINDDIIDLLTPDNLRRTIIILRRYPCYTLLQLMINESCKVLDRYALWFSLFYSLCPIYLLIYSERIHGGKHGQRHFVISYNCCITMF